MKRVTILVLFIVGICHFQLIASSRIDSLKNCLLEIDEDTNRVELLLELSKAHFRNDRNSKSSAYYLETALTLSNKLNYLKGIVKYWDLKGYQHRNRSEYKKALYCHFEAMELAKKIKSEKSLSTIYNNIGVVYRRLDEYNKGLDFHLKALEIAEKYNQRLTQSMAINSIGNIYTLMHHYDEALEYYKRAMQIAKEDKHLLSQAINYNNIGEVYEMTGKYEKALVFYHKSLKLNEEINSSKGQSICFDCIGNVYNKTNELNKALEYYEKALEINLQHEDKYFAVVSYNNIGEIYIKLGNYSKAMDHLQKALDISLEIGSKMQIKKAYENLSSLFEKNNLKGKALEYYKKSILYKDSILNEESNKNIAKLQVLYNSEKQLREIQSLRKEQELKEKDLQRKSLIITFLIIAVLMVLIFALLLFRSYTIKRRANQSLLNKSNEINQKNILLEQQKNEIEAHREEIEKQQRVVQEKNQYLEQANTLIEAKNKKITSSIGYARRIQQAMLPPDEVIKSYFNEFFIFYRPKDIVSGDFYWFDMKEESIFFASVDCTGHGVPGAFMSFVGFNLLNRALYEEKLHQPSHILNFLHSGIKSTLRKKETNAIKDGMDIALCKYNYNSYELEYAGALIPLMIIREGKIIEFKADYSQLGEIDEDFFEPFTNNKLRVYPGDNVYLFSDGFMDQFGGKYNKKFLKKRFVKTLQENSGKSMQEQEQVLSRTFDNWKGDNEQVDDVLVIGIKIH